MSTIWIHYQILWHSISIEQYLRPCVQFVPNWPVLNLMKEEWWLIDVFPNHWLNQIKFGSCFVSSCSSSSLFALSLFAYMVSSKISKIKMENNWDKNLIRSMVSLINMIYPKTAIRLELYKSLSQEKGRQQWGSLMLYSKPDGRTRGQTQANSKHEVRNNGLKGDLINKENTGAENKNSRKREEDLLELRRETGARETREECWLVLDGGNWKLGRAGRVPGGDRGREEGKNKTGLESKVSEHCGKVLLWEMTESPFAQYCGITTQMARTFLRGVQDLVGSCRQQAIVRRC